MDEKLREQVAQILSEMALKIMIGEGTLKAISRATITKNEKKEQLYRRVG